MLQADAKARPTAEALVFQVMDWDTAVLPYLQRLTLCPVLPHHTKLVYAYIL